MHNAILLSDSRISPDAIAHALRSVSIFHFAGHGWSAGDNGALLLGGSQGESAEMGAREIASQNWDRCRLAVLAACLTGVGEGRGPVNSRSLVRALLAAGAHRVIAARWSVDAASTQALMTEFYNRLFAGGSPAEALAEAKAKIAATPGWRHPYYWAGFDLYVK
jgi:CHAT domain-containing protein